MKMPVFKKNQEKEKSLVMGLLLGLIFCIGDNSPLNLVQALCLGFVLSLCIHMIKSLFCKYYLAAYQEEKFIFNGNIDSLISNFYKAGLKLEDKLGGFYLFTTNYRFLPNNEIIVRNNEDCCYLSGKQILFKYLRSHIILEKISSQSNADYNERADIEYVNTQAYSSIHENRNYNRK